MLPGRGSEGAKMSLRVRATGGGMPYSAGSVRHSGISPTDSQSSSSSLRCRPARCSASAFSLALRSDSVCPCLTS